MSAEALAHVLRPVKNLFKPEDYPDLLVGLRDPDDAAVWRLEEGRGLVVTTDFFTPVVDNPYDYGAIAAANALSDVYAMGGKPFLALNIAALPPDLPEEIGSEILRGGAETALKAGVVIAGGHTIQDKEPKYGLVVLGFVDPVKMLTKSGAQPGDVLLLSKPLGFGTITTALKQDLANPSDVDEAVHWMKQLNKTASELAVEFNLRCATDITGFSLLGHGWELAEASSVGLRFFFNNIPFVKGVKRYADGYIFPGGASDNRQYFESHVQFNAAIDEASQMLLFDPQTSGGLLLAAPRNKLMEILERSSQLNQPLWHIGEVTNSGLIEVQS